MPAASRGQLVLVLEVYADEEGALTARFDGDVTQAEAARLVGVIADQLDPARDRADEVQAWGAGRRRKV